MSSKASASKNLRRSPRAAPRKRGMKESPVTAPGPKRKCIGQKSQDGRYIDRYCWVCHKSDNNSQDKICFTCPRVYHSACLDKGSNVFSDKDVCPECTQISVDGTKPSKTLTCRKLRELLLATTEHKISEKEFRKNKIFFRWPPNTELVKVFDFQMLIDKMNDDIPYTKTSEFLSDLKWIQHNCFILFGATSKVTDAAVKLVKSFKTDLLDLEACPDCYYHMLRSTSSDFFVRICDNHHDIIWAQVSGYPYWPAKCLKIVNGSAHVRFFGRHEIGKIPISQCYFISKEHPNHPQKSVPKTPKYNAALIELARYVGLYERTFGVGTFHYYDGKTAFKPENAVPKPVENVPEETVPVSKTSKPNITTLPLCIDLIAPEKMTSYEEETHEKPINSAAISSSNAVTVSMTFIEEQSKTFGNEYDSSVPFSGTSMDSTYDALQSVDLQMCTATVVTPTPIVTSADSLINLSPGDLNLGAELSDASLVHESHNETMTNNLSNESPSSEMLLQTVSNTEQVLIPQTIMPISSPRVLVRDWSNALKNFKPYSECIRNIPRDDDVIILDSTGSEIGPLHRPHVDESLIMTYLTSHGKMMNINKDARALIYSLFIHLWALSNSAPTAPEVLTSVVLDLRRHKDVIDEINKENDNFKLRIDRNQIVIDKLYKEIKALKLSLEKEKQKNTELKSEFNDATKNAKLVVDIVKRSSDNVWAVKFKEHSTICDKKLSVKDCTIAEFEQQLEKLKGDYDALAAQKQAIENTYEKVLNELEKSKTCHKFCQETQTEVPLLETELDILIQENTRNVKHSMEQEFNEQIIQAKQNAFCYACLKPANIHCCMSANYCTKSCQRRHSKGHAKVCQRPKETRSRLEPEVPQHKQFGHPMINQLNQTQTYASKTTSFLFQFEQSDVITTATKDPNLISYPPASTSVSTNQKS